MAGVCPDLEVLRSPGRGPGVVATQESTHGVLTVMQSQIGDGRPLHLHQHKDESRYIMDRALTSGAVGHLPRRVAPADRHDLWHRIADLCA